MKNVLILPEIIHLCEFLQLISQGAVTIEGIGTDTLTITSPGLDIIHQQRCTAQQYVIGPDKCEIPFWICATALTGGDITCHIAGQNSIIPQMKRMNNALLQQAGIPLEILDANQFRINCDSEGYRPQGFRLLSTQHELDGIAFDACPILATILFKAQGEGSFYCYRYKFERIRWTKQLPKVGAKMRIENDVLLTEGCDHLIVNESIMLGGHDIRGASGVLLIALASEGEPLFVRGIEHIERGMEDVIVKLQSVGALINTVHAQVLVS